MTPAVHPNPKFVLLCTAWLQLLWAGSASTGSVGGVEDPEAPVAVAALGRIEPEGGVVRVVAPSTPLTLGGSVLSSLLVEAGDFVDEGQLLGVSDTAPALEAALNLATAELQLARRSVESMRSRVDEACILADVQTREAERRTRLAERSLASIEEVEQARGEAESRSASCVAVRAELKEREASVEVAEAKVELRAREHERAYIRAPFEGRVLQITARPGEYVGEEGFLVLGRVGRMFAIAEVYETQIRSVVIGDSAIVRSGALQSDLSGRVEFIRPIVARHRQVDPDPAAPKDARIIEVGIALDAPEMANSLTNLQVEVFIQR